MWFLVSSCLYEPYSLFSLTRKREFIMLHSAVVKASGCGPSFLIIQALPESPQFLESEPGVHCYQRSGERQREPGQGKGRRARKTLLPSCSLESLSFPGQLNLCLNRNAFWEVISILVLLPGPTLADAGRKQASSSLYGNGILAALAGISMSLLPFSFLPITPSAQEMLIMMPFVCSCQYWSYWRA